MNTWLISFLVLGAVLPIVVALTTIYFGTRHVPSSGPIVRATGIGLALGAIGGLIVSGIVIGAALALRAAR